MITVVAVSIVVVIVVVVMAVQIFFTALLSGIGILQKNPAHEVAKQSVPALCWQAIIIITITFAANEGCDGVLRRIPENLESKPGWRVSSAIDIKGRSRA